MNNHMPTDVDTMLDEQIRGLKQAPLPEGPSPAVTAATLRRLQGDTANSSMRLRPRWQSLLHQPLLRLAAAVLVIVGLYALLAGPLGGGSIAFAQVAEQIKAARSVAYTVSVTTAAAPPMIAKVIFNADGEARRELPGGSILIQDHRRSLLLKPADHSAVLYEAEKSGTPPREPDTAQRILESFQHLESADAKPLGEKAIDGRAVRGFTANLAGVPVDVWADAKTATPVRMEWNAKVGDIDMQVVVSDFALNVPTDDAMFSTEPPAGYTLTTEKLPTMAPGELPQDIAKLLGDYAKLSDGSFPDRLDDWNAFITVAAKLDPKAMQAFITRLGLINGQLFSRPNGYGYQGSSVKLGDKDKLIFWLTPTKDEATTPAVFGDLRVETIPVAKLPATLIGH